MRELHRNSISLIKEENQIHVINGCKALEMKFLTYMHH